MAFKLLKFFMICMLLMVVMPKDYKDARPMRELRGRTGRTRSYRTYRARGRSRYYSGIGRTSSNCDRYGCKDPMAGADFVFSMTLICVIFISVILASRKKLKCRKEKLKYFCCCFGEQEVVV